MIIQYHRCGDYLLPNLALKESEQKPIGKYGRMRKHYLKEHRPILFSSLLLSEKLYHHLSEINQSCMEWMELLIRQMADREGVTEALKAANQMKWVRIMNACKAQTEEVFFQEIIFA